MRMALRAACILLSALVLAPACHGAQDQIRIFVVSSYHRDYLWSQDTHKGVCAGLLDFKFLADQKQADEYTQNDYLETDKVVIRKAWMDTKRKSQKNEIAAVASLLMRQINEFNPDLVLLGDDNAAHYIGTQLIDSDIPVVFWGLDGSPLKYGLLDSLDRPGHNVTGVYQPGYYRECLEYFKKLIPGIRSFAVLSDDSETGRVKAKMIKRAAEEGGSGLALTEIFMTNSFEEWKAAALRLQDKVDAFFVVNHNTLKDEQGMPLDPLKAGAWYLRNIRKPECVPEKQFILEGMLLTVDDSGFQQGYEAAKIAHMILHEKKDAALIPAVSPSRGAIILNRLRAKALGIDPSDKSFIEEYVDTSLALEKYPH